MQLNNSTELVKSIEEKRNNIKGDRLDMSFGEIINLYEDEDLVITPEYQRAFRWEKDQKTGFIESILLGIPVPAIFVAEDQDGKWELVDGLQRISTILSFFGKLKDNVQNNLTLEKGNLIKELEGIKKDSIPIKLSNTIKRSICRVEILRWDSSIDIRYELFNRLNTTASPLTPQEIRNCVFRSHGNVFNSVLQEIASSDEFERVVKLSDKQKIEMFGEELVLRFFCFQHDYFIKDSLQRHLNQYMKEVTQGTIKFDSEKKLKFFEILKLSKFDYFRKNGMLSHRYWDGILYFLAKTNKNDNLDDKVEKLKEKIDGVNISKTVQHKDRPRVAIEIAKEIIEKNE